MTKKLQKNTAHQYDCQGVRNNKIPINQCRDILDWIDLFVIYNRVTIMGTIIITVSNLIVNISFPPCIKRFRH